MSSADTTGELHQKLAEIAQSYGGYIGVDNKELWIAMFEQIEKVAAAQKQRWEAEARLRGRIAEVNKLGVNGLLGQWDVDRIVDKYEQELAALDGVIPDVLDLVAARDRRLELEARIDQMLLEADAYHVAGFKGLPPNYQTRINKLQRDLAALGSTERREGKA